MAHRSRRRVEPRQHAVRTGAGRSSVTSAGGSCASVQAADAATAHLVDHFHAVSQGVAEANIRALHLRPERVTVVERGRSRQVLGTWSAARRDAGPRSAWASRRTPRSCSPSAVRSTRSARSTSSPRPTRCSIEFAGLRVLIAGRPGNATPALQRALADHPRAAAITTLLGHRHDVPDLLCAADVLAIPSLYEGTAGAAIEAMALRCPVVCTDVDGCPRHPATMGTMPCWSRPASRRASPTGWSERCTTISWPTRCAAAASPTSRSASRSKRRRPGWRSCTPRSPEAAPSHAGDEAARAGPRVAPHRGGLIEAHRWAAARPRLPPHR